jgi:hypothetical protein
MKIEGTVNIMGMKEVIFQQELPISYGGYDEISYYVMDGTTNIRWKRLGNGIPYFRDHDEMIRSIKNLSFNPHVELIFNDGAMYVNFKCGRCNKL